jgi:hypothetical protein
MNHQRAKELAEEHWDRVAGGNTNPPDASKTHSIAVNGEGNSKLKFRQNNAQTHTSLTG